MLKTDGARTHPRPSSWINKKEADTSATRFTEFNQVQTSHLQESCKLFEGQENQYFREEHTDVITAASTHRLYLLYQFLDPLALELMSVYAYVLFIPPCLTPLCLLTLVLVLDDNTKWPAGEDAKQEPAGPHSDSPLPPMNTLCKHSRYFIVILSTSCPLMSLPLGLH